MRYNIKTLLAVGMAAAVLTACSGGGTETKDSGQTVSETDGAGGGAVQEADSTTGSKDSVIVVMGPTSEPEAGFDPAYGWGAGEHVHEPLIQSTLTVTNPDLTIGYDLATEMECSGDGLTWTVKIRVGVRFTDGEALSARDVAFTYNTLRDTSSVNDFTMLERAERLVEDGRNVVILLDSLTKLTRAYQSALVQGGLDDLSLRDLRLDYDIRVGGENQVLDVVRRQGSITRNEVMALLRVSKNTAYNRLRQMVARGKLTKVGNRYYLPSTVVPPEDQEQAILAYLSEAGFAYRQDIARVLRIGPRQCWPILQRMLAEHQIAKDGQKYILLQKEA